MKVTERDWRLKFGSQGLLSDLAVLPNEDVKALLQRISSGAKVAQACSRSRTTCVDNKCWRLAAHYSARIEGRSQLTPFAKQRCLIFLLERLGNRDIARQQRRVAAVVASNGTVTRVPPRHQRASIDLAVRGATLVARVNWRKAHNWNKPSKSGSLGAVASI